MCGVFVDKIYVQFGDPVFLRLKESMYIYTDTWTSRLRSLMMELLPQIYNEVLKAYEASPVDYDYLIRRCKEMNVEVETEHKQATPIDNLNTVNAQLNNSQLVNNVRLNISQNLPQTAKVNNKIKATQLLDSLKNPTPNNDYNVNAINNSVNSELESCNSNIEITNPEIIHAVETYDFKTKPFKHQLVGVEFGLEVNRYLLGDEMGLGKTKQIIDLACIRKNLYGYKHCLIICCVNGLKWNWAEEIEIHSNEKSHILGCRKNTKGKYVIRDTKAKLEDIRQLGSGKFDDKYFIITNIESLRDTAIAQELSVLCDAEIINMIAVDEIHKCASNESKQTKGLLKLRTDSMIAMTGSPIMNSALDLYVPLNWLGYDRHSFYDYKNHFCRMGPFGITGYKHMDEIQNMLKYMMLRRLKKDHLKDLPDKIYSTEYVEMNNHQAAIYNEVLNGLRKEVDLIARSTNPLGNLIRLRQATGHTSLLSSTVSCSAKLDRLLELLKDYTDNGHKIIIFSNFAKMVELIKLNTLDYNPAVITGATKDRQGEKNRFMTDDNCKIIIGTIGAMGTGLTLTAADVVIFFDEPWTSGNKLQAEDRAHRIGAKNNVQIITLVTKNTIDERIFDIVKRKALISDNLIDNLSCADITNLLNFLLF